MLPFSVSISGRLMMFSTCMTISSGVLAAKALLDGGRGVLREHQVLEAKEVVDVDAFGRQILVVREVPRRHAQVLVAADIDQQRALADVERVEHGAQPLGLDLGQLKVAD